MTLLRLIILTVLSFGAASADGNAASTNPVRAALMTFTTDDNSYRSSVAAANLAAALQAELSTETGINWVERIELKAAESELELSELGLPDSAGALRRGRFVGADWVVVGSFKGATNQQWTLTIEVIDVRRADLLASRTTEISRIRHPTLKSALPQVASVATAIRTVSRDALERWESVRHQRTLAFLMLLNMEKFESEVARGVEVEANGPNGWRVASFGRTGQSFGENEMLLLGMIDQNSEAWESLADAYAWGHFYIRDRLTLATNRIPSKNYLPVLEISVWNRRGEAATVSIEGELAQSHGVALAQAGELATRVPKQLLNALNGVTGEAPMSEVRSRIANTLLEQARTWRNESGNGASDEATQRRRLLETAFFFDPRNQVISEHLLGIPLKGAVESSPPNRFWLLFQENERIGVHVDRFGLRNHNSDATIAAPYLSSAWQLVELAQLGNKEDYGFPRDMSGEIVRKWLKAFCTELAGRVIKTADQPHTRGRSYGILRDGLTGNPSGLMLIDPKLRLQCIEALWPAFVDGVPPGSRQEDYSALCRSVSATCAELGFAGREKTLLNLLDKPKVAKPKTPVRLPRASDLEPRQQPRPFGPSTKP